MMLKFYILTLFPTSTDAKISTHSQKVKTTNSIKMYQLSCTDTFHITKPANTYIYDIVPVGKLLATISSDDSLRILNPLALEAVPLNSIAKINADVTCLKSLRDDGDSTVVCTAGRDGVVCMIDLRSNSVVAKVKSGKPSFDVNENSDQPLLKDS